MHRVKKHPVNAYNMLFKYKTNHTINYNKQFQLYTKNRKMNFQENHVIDIGDVETGCQYANA